MQTRAQSLFMSLGERERRLDSIEARTVMRHGLESGAHVIHLAVSILYVEMYKIRQMPKCSPAKIATRFSANRVANVPYCSF